MKQKEKHRFKRVYLHNRWTEQRWSRRGDWLLLGVYKRWGSVYSYCYTIGLFGFEISIWIEREFINK